MPTRKSARLQENNEDDDQDLFVVDDEDAPSLNGETINENDHWITVWSKLKKAGWGWKQGNAISSYFYTKPNINSIKDKRQGIDFFVKEDHVKKYVEVKYNWSQRSYRDRSSDVDDNIHDTVDKKENEKIKKTNQRVISDVSENKSSKSIGKQKQWSSNDSER